RANNLVTTVSSTDTFLTPGGGGTYPRLAQLADGSVLGSFIASSGGQSILTVTRSTDGGRTFTPSGIVATGTSNINDLDNLHLVQLPNGSILATFRNHDKTAPKVYTFYRMRIYLGTLHITASISHDNGKTWAFINFISQVDQRTLSGMNGLWEHFGRISVNGAVQVYYAAENAQYDQDILMRTSTDNGATWSAATTVAGKPYRTGRDGMPVCTTFTTPAGAARLLCVFETTKGTAPLFTVKSVESSNDGRTFGSRAQVFVPGGRRTMVPGAPFIVTTTAGTLVLPFMTDEDMSAHNWANDASMKIVTSLSTDPPVWGQKTTVLGVSSYWPGLYHCIDGSGTVVGCADLNGARCLSISFA
ncbi:glycoside hydrolase family 93 protein, partial [Mycena rosella]